MPTPSFSGGVVIIGSRVILPIDIATIEPGIIIPITGTVEIGNQIQIGTVQVVLDVATINTITGTVDVSGTIEIGTILQPITIATVLNPSSVFGTIEIGTIQNAPLITAQGTVEIGTILQPLTIATVLNPSSVLGTVQIGTIFNNPLVTVQNTINQINILSGATVSSSGATIIQMGRYQDLVIDIIYGTVLIGSIQTVVSGVEPQSGLNTSVLISGSWYAGTIISGQRLSLSKPNGVEVSVSWNVVGTVQQVYITAEQST
jgi:hypothetical protein